MIIDSLQFGGLCTCKREHQMQTLFSVVESGCLKEIDSYREKFNLLGYTTAVYDTNTYAATSDRHPNTDFEVILEAENLHANEHGVALLMEKLPENTEILIAVGSGTIHDIVRYCAYQKGIDFISCPTAASVDGFCSSVAAMTWNGCKKTLTAVSPKIVIADLDVIKRAPLRLARSGFGDMVGKYVALCDWKIAHIITGEFYCERIAQMTLDATKAVLSSAPGLASGNESSFENLTYGLLLSGLAMQLMGNSRPASGAEHHISHVIEMEPAGLGVHSDALHGEKVGVGTLLALTEYHAIASRRPNFKDYSPYSTKFLSQIFDGEMLSEIENENKSDAAKGIQKERLEETWEAVTKEIQKLPDVQTLEKLYLDLGVKASLADIGVQNEKAKSLLDFSPCVRNRLTLMRLRKCL